MTDNLPATTDGQPTALATQSTAASALAMLRRLPDRLSDEQMTIVSEIASCPLPALPVSDERHFAAVMKGFQILPRKSDDGLTGELRFRAYFGALGDLPREQLDWMLREAVKRFHFHPSIKELVDLSKEWARRDDAQAAKRLARAKMDAELAQRERDAKPKPPQMTQADVDKMDAELLRLGVKCGALIQNDDGSYSPAPERAA